MIFFPLKLSNFRWKILHERQKCQIYELFFFPFFSRKQYKSKVEAPLMMQMMMVETDTLSAAFTARLRGVRG